MKVKVAVAGAAAAAGLVVGSLTLAGAQSAPSEITTCVHNKTGVMRVSTTCTSQETPLSWNSEGVQGEQGEQGEQGDSYNWFDPLQQGAGVLIDPGETFTLSRTCDPGQLMAHSSYEVEGGLRVDGWGTDFNFTTDEYSAAVTVFNPTSGGLFVTVDIGCVGLVSP